jgi:hypothetical protein
MSPRDTDFIETEARFGAHNYHPPGVMLSRGEGIWVWDTEGNRYLDDLLKKVGPRIVPGPDLTGAGYIRPRRHQFLRYHFGLARVND